MILFYRICFYFFIYAFLGWCCEVVYAALDTGRFVNRGFLCGPVCPIYGFGMLLVLVVLTPVSDRPVTLFIGSFGLTTAIEYLTGFLLERVFHDKWWDYSDEHFNLHGYVCLKFSILWGLACTFVMKCVHPLIAGVIDLTPRAVGIGLVAFFAALITVDGVMTVVTVLKLRRRMALIDTITSELKRISDTIGEGLCDGTIKGKRSAEQIMELGEEGFDRLRSEANSLYERLVKLKEERIFGGGRLLAAFPNLCRRFEQTKQLAAKFLHRK